MPHGLLNSYKNGVCERCHKQSNMFRMSIFNTQMICADCLEKEQNHPLYKKAVECERDEYLKGNMNFQGIGLPEDL